MGKGDKKTKKGKIWKGSYGVSRKRKSAKTVVTKAVQKDESKAAPQAAKPKKKVARKKKAE